MGRRTSRVKRVPTGTSPHRSSFQVAAAEETGKVGPKRNSLKMASRASRTLATFHSSERDDIGNLITRRPLPGPRVEQISPFLFLNHHGPQVYPPNNHGLPFGPHPHRGFETVTFILEGSLAHHDTGGHHSTIEAGGVQWMTAGRGLIHAEVRRRKARAKIGWPF
ncbi:pirin family protein [Sphingomonas sp. KRR8]|uniref:pirin family protein n=1 Tax=Sphingomonas sp. KRR8 TaxID=2942996 RepID=UPI0032E7FF30